MGALDDATLAAFLKRVENGKDGDDSTALLNKTMAESVRYLVGLGFTAEEIKTELHEGLSLVQEWAEARWWVLVSQRDYALQVGATDEPMESEKDDWHRTVCKWFNHQCGYGLLTAGEGTPDILIRKSVLDECGVDVPMRPGLPLDIRVGVRIRGVEAIEVAPAPGFW